MLDAKMPHLDLQEKAKAFRTMMIAFLLVYQLEGLVSFSLGIWLLVRLKAVSGCFHLYSINAASALLLTSGVLTVCVCMLGVITTAKSRNKQTLRPFVVFFVVLVALELSAAIVSTVDQQKLDDRTFYNNMKLGHTLLINDQDKEERIERLQCWMDIQMNFKCCGVDKYTDWISDPSANRTIHPDIARGGLDSCTCGSNWRQKERKCIDTNVTIGAANTTSNFSLYTAPCYDELYTDIERQTNLIRLYCPILVIVQIVAFAFIFCFISKIRKANAIEIYGVADGLGGSDAGSERIFSVPRHAH